MGGLERVHKRQSEMEKQMQTDERGPDSLV